MRVWCTHEQIGYVGSIGDSAEDEENIHEVEKLDVLLVWRRIRDYPSPRAWNIFEEDGKNRRKQIKFHNSFKKKTFVC